ncbi:PAS domain S-box protein [Deinococcus sonorensis]|uniref:histidine kinase n=2 Tax=Deinococcus sonorensis TaxID=309891 RepID=A0AAU7UCF9_9DEIO
MTLPTAPILIVDDQASKRLALAAALEVLEQPIVFAGSGEEALRLLLKGDFAVILLDVRMPGMDGFETASLIRSRPQSESTPIIFVTAYDRAETELLGGYRLGAVDFIFAPVQSEILRAKVGVFVDLHLKTLSLQSQERQLRAFEAQRAQQAQTQLRRESQRARQERDKLSRALDQLADPVFITDRAGTIEYVNPAFETVTGYRRDQALGRRPDLLKSGVHDDAFYADMWTTLARGDTYRGEVVNRRQDGTLYTEEKTLTPLKDPRGNITHFVSTGRDITDRKHMEQELQALTVSLEARVQERTAQLQDMNAELEAFAYSVSHDLRTPLRHIASFADLLHRKAGHELSERSLGYLQTIQEATHRMDRLILGLLDFARTSRQDLDLRPVDLTALVREVIRELPPEDQSDRVRWNVQQLPVVQGDLTALRQVFVNLLSNALKYSCHREEVVIDIWATHQDHEHAVHIRDNGVGFDMAYANKLFGIFKRLHGNSFEGVGVGLSNVKRLVTRQGGRVWAEGREGEGATFSFALPDRERPLELEPVGEVGSETV